MSGKHSWYSRKLYTTAQTLVLNINYDFALDSMEHTAVAAQAPIGLMA